MERSTLLRMIEMYRTIEETGRWPALSKLHPQEISLLDLTDQDTQELYYIAGLKSIEHVEALVMQQERQIVQA